MLHFIVRRLIFLVFVLFGVTLIVFALLMSFSPECRAAAFIRSPQSARDIDKIVERFGDNPAAMKQAGIVYATEQIIDLMANGQNNIHIYTMNKPDVAGAIAAGLSEIIYG